MSRTTLRSALIAVGTAGLLILTPACSRHTAEHFTGSGAGTSSGLKACELSSLPPEAAATVRLIHSGGPFPYSRDGIIFGNFEHRLPQENRGYYHEYTVPTPGAKTRGTRRVITGGTPLTKPPEFYYTGDHYETFCQIGGA
jgi:guanyl-specific ribonuclease Sa